MGLSETPSGRWQPQAPPGAALQFGNCEVSVAQREIRLDDRPAAVAPKVFDLLVFLIERRKRVVRKQELLDAIWSGVVVSDSVVARAVMKARQAIGDSASHPTMLKTFPRVGYSFVADVVEAEGDRAGAAARPSAEQASALRIAIVPFETEAGVEGLPWIGAGLSGLVAQALRADRRLRIAEASSVTDAVSQLDAGESRKRFTQKLMALVGADCTVQASLRSSATGYKLHYWIRGSCDLQGVLGGDEPTALGQRLANLVETALFPGANWPVPFESADALANQAFARAIHLNNQQRFSECARMLEIVLDIEPGSASAGLQYLRVLANLSDKRSLQVGQRLLERATRDADIRLLAATHEAMARAFFNLGSAYIDRSREHMRKALDLAPSFKDEEWVVRIYIGEALDSQLAREYVRADAFYELAWRANESVGNLTRRAIILANRAALEYAVGRLLVAVDLAEQALSIFDRLALSGNGLEVRAWLSRSEAALGLFARAAEHDEVNIGELARVPAIHRPSVAFALEVIAENAFEARDAGPLLRAIERHAFAADWGDSTVDALARVADAHLAALEGRRDAMSASMRAALDAVRSGPEIEKTHQWMIDRLEMAHRLDWTDEIRYLEPQIEALLASRQDDELEAALLRAHAARAHGKGDAASARKCLAKAVAVSSPGRMNALASIDLAWLKIEEGESACAARLLRNIGPWLLQHPTGLAASARLHLAFGRRIEGHAAVEACADRFGKAFPTAFMPLRHAFDRAGEIAARIPAIERLPTSL